MRRPYEIIKAIDKEKLFNKVKEVFFVKEDPVQLVRAVIDAEKLLRPVAVVHLAFPP